MKEFRVALLFPVLLGAQTLEVIPRRVLLDEPATIRAHGLQPGERVTIHSELIDGAGAGWSAQGDFVADAQGDIDVSKQAPVGGAYKEVNPMGLIWFMMPHGGRAAMYQSARELAPITVRFQMKGKGGGDAEASLEHVSVADGVRRVPVHEGALRGMLFVPPGSGRVPAVLVVGGSNGGVPVLPAAWLADHGFVALALGYFHYQDLPPMLERIPLEYFQQGLEWLSRRPEVEATRIAVMGTSRGGELALQLGSMFPAIRAVVAYVPANVRYAACCGPAVMGAAWTWGGKPLPFAMPWRGINPTEAAIEVERTRGPILMISGEDDHLWNSWQMADAVMSRLKRAGFGYSFENLKYPHAGHMAGRPEIRPAWHGAVRQPISGRMNDLGGSAKGDAESSMDSMPKVIDFLTKNLSR
jgi:dienelactone hydrolase